MQKAFWIGTLLTSLFLGACTKETIIEKQSAPADIRESLKIPDSEICKQKNCVQIQKSSFEKTFILITSGRVSGLTPQWYDLKPQIVTFAKAGGEVAILAENYNTIYNEIKSNHLIQSFPIISENESSVTFDLGSGFNSFAMEEAIAIETPDKPWGPDGSFRSIPVTDSFVQDVKIQNQEHLEFNQIAKVVGPKLIDDGENPSSMVFTEESVGMNVQIRPYKLGSDFKSKPADTSGRVGFFVTQIAVKEQSAAFQNLIAKWDLSEEKGPITVRISSAVPPTFLESVQEGALYWNKVLKREAIVIETGVDPNSNPVHRSITIRWLPWMDAGAAYAMNQSDPLTGEIFRGQVFMPSAFTQVGSASQVRMNDDVPVAVGAVRCEFAKKFSFLQSAEVLALPPSERTRLAQDAVRTTVAHELGHALGLRHNFAASYSAKVSAKEVMEASKTLLRNPNHKGLPVATSVMDYLTGIDDNLTSRYIRNNPLSYDMMAMDWAYASDDAALNEEVSLYCSDEHIGMANSQGFQIYGCERFDVGSNPVERTYLETLKEKEIHVKTLFTSIIGRMFPPDQPDVKVDLRKVLVDTQKWSAYEPTHLKALGEMLKVIQDGKGQMVTKYISIPLLKSGNFFLAMANKDPQFSERLLLDVKETGGYAYMLENLLVDSDGQYNLAWIEKQLADLMEQPYFKKGRTLGGRDYVLTAAEQELIATFFLNSASLNRNGQFLKKIAQILPFANANVEVSNMAGTVLRKGVVQPAEAEKLRSIYTELLTAEEFELQFGPEPRQTAVVAKSLLNASENLLFKVLVESSLMNIPLEVEKVRVIEMQSQKINAALALIDPTFNLSSPLEWEAWPAKLRDADLVDAASADYFKTEITILKQLTAQPTSGPILK